MNLEIRKHDDRTTVLTDDRGWPLPGQVHVAWDHDEPGSLARLTVSFIVDGRNIRFGDGPPTGPSGSLPEAAATYGALSPENKERFRVMHDLTTVRLARELVADKAEGMEADLYQAVLVAYRRGAVEWAQMNYPLWAERLAGDAQ